MELLYSAVDVISLTSMHFTDSGFDQICLLTSSNVSVPYVLPTKGLLCLLWTVAKAYHGLMYKAYAD
jgi:hypothetical protein